MAFRSNSQMADITKPKHIPHMPCNNVNIITPTISPLHVTSNTRIMKISTRAVWPHITTNWVTTCENRISNGVTPATHDRSSKPCKVINMINMINIDWFAFEAYPILPLYVQWSMPKMSVQQPRRIQFYGEIEMKIVRHLCAKWLIETCPKVAYVRMTPGATKSVNDGVLVP